MPRQVVSHHVHAVEQILQVALRLALLYYNTRPVAAAQGTGASTGCTCMHVSISRPQSPRLLPRTRTYEHAQMVSIGSKTNTSVDIDVISRDTFALSDLSDWSDGRENVLGRMCRWWRLRGW